MQEANGTRRRVRPLEIAWQDAAEAHGAVPPGDETGPAAALAHAMVVAHGADWRSAGIAALVWDGAPSLRPWVVREAGPPSVTQPPASPELNPPGRVFQELRRAVGGVVYATLDDEVAAVERKLTAQAVNGRAPDAPERLDLDRRKPGLVMSDWYKVSAGQPDRLDA